MHLTTSRVLLWEIGTNDHCLAVTRVVDGVIFTFAVGDRACDDDILGTRATTQSFRREMSLIATAGPLLPLLLLDCLLNQVLDFGSACDRPNMLH